MSRYIKLADALRTLADTCYLDEIDENMQKLPSIDIVRCKECKRRKKNGFCLEHNRYEKNDNGYCSYGVRLE